MSSPVIKLKRGAYADLPTLGVGEPGFTTDRYQLFVGSHDGNKIIGGGEFWNLNSTTVGGGIKVYEATNNGTNFIELRSPASLAASITYLLPGADGAADQVLKTDGSGNLTFAAVNTLTNAGLDSVVEDTTPQLGGNLDLNSKTINGSGNISYSGNLTASGNASFNSGNAVINDQGASISGIVTATTFSGSLATNLLTGTITNTQLAGSIVDSKLNQIVTAEKVALSALDIDGGTDIGAAVVDADLFIVDDGGGGTNRKTTAARIKSYVLGGGGGGSTFDSVTVGSGVTIDTNGINAPTGIVTASSFVGNLTGNVTGNSTSSDTVDVTEDSGTNTSYQILFTDGDGSGKTLREDTGLNYNPAANTLTTSEFVGDITGDVTGNVTGNLTGTVQTASQTNITSVGTLGSLAVTNNITVGGTVDGRDVLDDGQAGDNLVTLSGVARDATNLGSFTGSTISDNLTVKAAIQEVETQLDSIAGGGAAAASVAVGQTDANTTHFVTFVSDNNTNPTQESIRTDAGVSYNPSTNTLTATNIAGALTGNVTGNVTGNLDGIVGGNTPAAITGTTITANTNFAGNLTGNVTGTASSATAANTVFTQRNETSGNYYFTFVDDNNVAPSANTLYTDTSLNVNPSTNIVSGGGMDMVAYFINSVEITSTATELNFLDGSTADGEVVASKAVVASPERNLNNLGIVTATAFKGGTVNITSTSGLTIDGVNVTATGTELNILDGVTSFLDEDNMASNSATSIPSQQSVKAYVDTEVGNVQSTITLNGDSTAGIVTTGQTLSIDGTANEIETAVVSDTFTIGLPASVVVTTELEVPTLEVGAIQANDGTASMAIANSTGNVTITPDLTVNGSVTAAAGMTVQGNTAIGDQTSDTVGFTARVNSDFVPSSDSARQIGSNSLRWKDTFSDNVTGTNFTAAGILTAADYRGGSMTLTGGGNFGGNVDISGNLSVGGSITSINVDDFKSVSPLIEVGLEDVGDGTFQPPSFVTQYNTGIAMWYNPVGVSSANAKAASIFAAVKPGGSFRVGFATVVAFSGSGTTDGVATVTNWADIEAKGLWINDCAGQSQVISCTGSTRNLNNITIDAGAFS